MMKRIVELLFSSLFTIFIAMLIALPSAIAQHRKPIPAGRYEALSGVTKSYGFKNSDNTSIKDSQGFFWSAVTKHMLKNQDTNFFYNTGSLDKHLQAFFSSNGIFETKVLDHRVSILLSDNFNRDNEIFKKMKTKGGLIVLRDKNNLKNVLSVLSRYKVIIYQEEVDNNYFLLQLK